MYCKSQMNISICECYVCCVRMKVHPRNNNEYATLVLTGTKEQSRLALHIAKLIQFVPVQTVRCIVLLECEKTVLSRSPSLNIIKENPILHIDSISHTTETETTHRQRFRQHFYQPPIKTHVCTRGGLCEYTSTNINGLIKTQKFINIYVRAYVPSVCTCRSCIDTVWQAWKTRFKILN